MPKLAIYFSSPGALDYPLSKKNFLESYIEIIDVLESRGVEVGIVRGNSYLGGGQWSSYFKKNGGHFEPIHETFHSDLIWNKDDKNTIPKIMDCPIINQWEFDDICRDKVKTHEAFKEFTGETILLKSFEDLQERLKLINNSKIVLKPRFGEQSLGVYVLSKDEIHRDLYQDWSDILLQEFLDSSQGIPGLTPGIHEVKICMVNGKFAGARLKEYPNGVYVVSHPDPDHPITKIRNLSEDELPGELNSFVYRIEEKLGQFYPRIYRADFLRTEKGYKMIEINSRPSISHASKVGPEYWQFNGAIVDAICDFFKE